MFLGGLWHGAAMTFVIWGTIHGLALIIERLLKVRRFVDQGLGRIVGVLVTFHIVCLAWIFFRANSLELALAYIEGITLGTTDIYLFSPFIAGLIALCAVGQFVPERSYERCYWTLSKAGTVGMMVIFALGMVAIQQIAPSGTAPFIYFQF